MKSVGMANDLYKDLLGSVSVVADISGLMISKSLYHSWGTTRYQTSTSPTNCAFTSHTLPSSSSSGNFRMQEGDIYFYSVRWPQVPEAQRVGFDPQLVVFYKRIRLSL